MMRGGFKCSLHESSSVYGSLVRIHTRKYDNYWVATSRTAQEAIPYVRMPALGFAGALYGYGVSLNGGGPDLVPWRLPCVCSTKLDCFVLYLHILYMLQRACPRHQVPKRAKVGNQFYPVTKKTLFKKENIKP